MGCPALFLGELYTSLRWVHVKYWDGCKSHQWAISIVKTIFFSRILRPFLYKLIHRNFDISSKTNRVLSASIIKAMMKPHMEHKSDMLSIEFKLIYKKRIGNTESHATVIGPDSNPTESGL